MGDGPSYKIMAKVLNIVVTCILSFNVHRRKNLLGRYFCPHFPIRKFSLRGLGSLDQDPAVGK